MDLHTTQLLRIFGSSHEVRGYYRVPIPMDHEAPSLAQKL